MIETILRVGNRFFVNRFDEKRLFNNNSPNHSKSSLGNTQGKVSNRISNYIADEVRMIRTKFSFCFINQFINFIFLILCRLLEIVVLSGKIHKEHTGDSTNHVYS